MPHVLIEITDEERLNNTGEMETTYGFRIEQEETGDFVCQQSNKYKSREEAVFEAQEFCQVEGLQIADYI